MDPASGFAQMHSNALTLLENNRDLLIGEFAEAFANKAGVFTAWLGEIGVNPSGRLAIDLLRGQAFLSLFGLAQRGLESLKARRDSEAAQGEECWLPFPFC
jgi:hypothetical protein